jgi:hypothetical protein
VFELLHHIVQIDSCCTEGNKKMEQEICGLFHRALVYPVLYGKDKLGGLLTHFLQDLINAFFVSQEAGSDSGLGLSARSQITAQISAIIRGSTLPFMRSPA